MSLEDVARRSGVSRAMIHQIEAGRSSPTVKVLEKVARALDQPLTRLLAASVREVAWPLPASQARLLRSADGRVQSRALFPFDGEQATEFYELRLAAGAVERSTGHAAGTLEHLVVVAGRATIEVATETFVLSAGDALSFRADETHAYRNDDLEPVVLHLVVERPAAVDAS